VVQLQLAGLASAGCRSGGVESGYAHGYRVGGKPWTALDRSLPADPSTEGVDQPGQATSGRLRLAFALPTSTNHVEENELCEFDWLFSPLL
jgi:hypothetical protein